MNQLEIFTRFDGSDYLPERDDERLTRQHEKVFRLMKDGMWRSLDEISEAIKEPQASVSAQLRHLRKPRFGGHTVNKTYRGNGIFKYQLVVKNILEK